MRNKMGFVCADRLDEMESVMGQSSKREIESMALMMFVESCKAELVRD
jgi:hypothetical protein